MLSGWPNHDWPFCIPFYCGSGFRHYDDFDLKMSHLDGLGSNNYARSLASYALSIQWCYFTPLGSPGVSRRWFWSPHLCFIISFICDLCVARNDSLMNWNTPSRTEQIHVIHHSGSSRRRLESRKAHLTRPLPRSPTPHPRPHHQVIC